MSFKGILVNDRLTFFRSMLMHRFIRIWVNFCFSLLIYWNVFRRWIIFESFSSSDHNADSKCAHIVCMTWCDLMPLWLWDKLQACCICKFWESVWVLHLGNWLLRLWKLHCMSDLRVTSCLQSLNRDNTSNRQLQCFKGLMWLHVEPRIDSHLLIPHPNCHSFSEKFIVVVTCTNNSWENEFTARAWTTKLGNLIRSNISYHYMNKMNRSLNHKKRKMAYLWKEQQCSNHCTHCSCDKKK